MSKFIATFITTKILAVTCVLTAVAAIGGPFASAANLVVNPSFETDSAGSNPITDWSTFESAPQVASLVGTNAHSGTNALEFCCGTINPDGISGSGFAGAFQRVLNVIPGTTYTFSVWAKADSGFLTDGPDTHPMRLGREDVGIKFEWHTDGGGATSPVPGSPVIEYGMITSQAPSLGIPARPALSDTYQQFVFPDVVAPDGAGHFRPVFAARHIDKAVYFDDIFMTQILPEDTPNFIVSVNRSTGNISIENNGTGTGDLKEIKITSASGALDPISWSSIAGNYDLAGNGSVDADDNWTRQTQTNAELRETGNDVSDGGAIAVGQVVNLGNNAWIQSLTEDLAVEVTYADSSSFRPGQTRTASVSFSGGPGGNGFVRSDLDFDGDIDAADWPLVRDQLFDSINTTSLAVAYQAGDLNGDLKADFGDFNVFKADYDAANGVGAFQAMIASVPEPSTVAMLALGLIGLTLSRKRALGKVACLLVATLAVGVVAPTTYAAQAIDFTTFTVDNYKLAGGGTVPSGGGPPEAEARFQIPTYTTTSSEAVLDVSANPHVFFGGPSILNKRITGTINAGGDDDFIGLALGYTAGDTTKTLQMSGGADFLLLDWKHNNSTQNIKDNNDEAALGQFFHDRTTGFLAKAGVALSRVEGTPTGDDLWGHIFDQFDSDSVIDSSNFQGGVTELQRGAASGLTGYVKNRGHVFDISYTATKIVVKIDGTEEINLTGSFPNGVLGLYSMDQNPTAGAATYSNFKISDFDEGLLTARVNTLSGSVTLINETSDPITLDGYKLESATGSLSLAGWNSFQDQNSGGFAAGNGSGNGWEEAGSSTDSALVEANLSTFSTLAPGASISLGAAFDTGSAQNVALTYSEGNGLVSDGLIEYVSTLEDADFNNDGDVDGSDFLTWQRGFGGSSASQGDANGSGTIDGADLAIWGALYGSGGSAVAASQNVPEPSSALLLILATCGLGISRLRR